MEKLFNKKTFFLSLIGALGGIFIIVSALKYGPAISTDSVAYIYAAESFIQGRGFIYFGYETPFIQWPPLFPVLIGVVSAALGLETSQAALDLNAVVFAVIIFFSGLWFYRNTKRYVFTVIGTFAVLLSIPVFKVAKFVWSEPLLILFSVLFFISIESYLKKDGNIHLLLAAVFTALACLTRYMGVVLVFTGLLMLLFQRKRLIRKFGEAFTFGFISSFPLLLWAIRNYIVSSTLFGARTPSNYTLRQNIEFTLHTVVSWFLPIERLSAVWGRQKTVLLTITILAAAAMLVLAGVFTALRRKHGKTSCASLIGMLCASVYIVIYTAYLIASATSVAFDTIDNRLMAPVYIPLVFIIVVAADGIAGAFKQARVQRITTAVTAVIFSTMLIYPAMSVAADVRSSVRSGAGIFSSDVWHGSDLITYLRKNPPKHQVYSNFPDAVYALTGTPARYTPKKNSLPDYGFERFEEKVKQAKTSYIVWFNKNTSSSIYNVDELRRYFKIEKITELEDGEIYEVK
jgi:hypothetical protein